MAARPPRTREYTDSPDEEPLQGSRMQEPVINSERLWQSMEDMAQIVRAGKGETRRANLPDGDRIARDLFVKWCGDAGCRITVDESGNIFARREGISNDLPPVMTGNRLDARAGGGRFNGTYGVLAGLEVIRALNDAGWATRTPLEVAVWTKEEGPQTTLAHPMAAFVGAHVEEAPVLERESRDIGVVTGVAGIRWYDVKVVGETAHPGTAPMRMRRDALVGAARIISEVNLIGNAYLPNAYATVGELNVHPNSRSAIPGHATFTVDLRHSEVAVLEAMERDMVEAVNKLSRSMRLRTTVKRVMDQPPLLYSAECVDVIREEARALGFTHGDVVSSARQDASYLARVVPTGMICVPFRGGACQNSKDGAAPDTLTAGCCVLLRSMVRLADWM